MKPLTLLIIAALPLLAADEKTTALFNGKDLSGWTFDALEGAEAAAKAWSAKDGVLVCTGEPIGVIRTETEFENYELTLEWRWPEAFDAAPNSGLLLHATTPRKNGPWPSSIEAQLGHKNAGDIWMIGVTAKVEGGENKGARWFKKEDSNEKPQGEWNEMRVICKDETLRIYVNGALQNDATELSATKGAIALQSEGSPIEFRNIKLTPVE
jgi:hypothetical protein